MALPTRLREMMRAGSLRERVSIERRSSTKTATGARVDTWSEVLAARAAIDLMRGQEEFAQQGIRSRAVYRVVIRWPRVEITSADRISWSSRTLDIVSVRNVDGRYRWAEILAAEAA